MPRINIGKTLSPDRDIAYCAVGFALVEMVIYQSQFLVLFNRL